MCLEPRSGRVFVTRDTGGAGGGRGIVTGGALGSGGFGPCEGPGMVSVLALASGHFLDRGPWRWVPVCVRGVVVCCFVSDGGGGSEGALGGEIIRLERV